MAIKMKRGTTESWALGPEMMHFEDWPLSSVRDVVYTKDTKIQVQVYTDSTGEWWLSSPNNNPQSQIIAGIALPKPQYRFKSETDYEIKIKLQGPEDCFVEFIMSTGTLWKSDEIQRDFVEQINSASGVFPDIFIKWPAEKVGQVEPEILTIIFSAREVEGCEELEEGQLGLEYTEDGRVKVKAGMPGVSKWNKLPYIGSIPDASNAESDGVALVAKNGEWVIDDIPVVRKDELAVLSQKVDLIFPGRNRIFDYINYEVIADNTVTIESCMSSILGDHVIPSTINGYPVTAIGANAFGGCQSLTSIIIPHGVTSIGSYAFYTDSKLTSITIPNTVTTIRQNAFEYTSLTDVYYEGTEEEWNALGIVNLGEVGATIHYNQAYATKEFVLDTISNMSITIDEINEICGMEIESSSEVQL